MGFRFDDWVYWQFFTITVNYNSSHIGLLLNVYLMNLCEESHFCQNLRLVCTTLISLLYVKSRIHCLLSLPCGPHRRHRVEQFLCCPVGCYGHLVFSNLLPGHDSFTAIHFNGNVIFELLLNNGCLALAPLFRLPAITSQHLQLLISLYH
jgi:hypothetical protein